MEDQAQERHFAGPLTRLLFEHVAFAIGPHGPAELCRRAGETRSPEDLTRTDTWCSYTQFRRLVTAAAQLTGGPAALHQVGAVRARAEGSTGLADSLQALGSADAAMSLVNALGDSLETIVLTESEQLAEGDWIVRRRFTEGYEPFPEYCAMLAGLIEQVPTLFGFPGHVAELECQRQGADACTFHLRWDAGAASVADVRLAELQVHTRALEARLASIEDTVDELISGEPVETVLDRIVLAASRALPGEGLVLALDATALASRDTFWHRLAASEAEACATRLREGDLPSSTWTVVEVASRRARYGQLVAVHLAPVAEDHQRPILSAYGRLAAAALDSASLLGEAHRQAEMASALLQLSQALADIGTTEQMARRLAAAIPTLIDCDQVIIARHEPNGGRAVLLAVQGYGEEVDRRMEGGSFELDASFIEAEEVRTFRQGDTLSEVDRGLLADAAALATVPLHAGGEVLGWVAVAVTDRPERLLDEPLLGERLRGLAGQGASALRNARLLDQMRFQAEHDPLTGLANQRLLRLHASQAITRARREQTQVGLLFLDLNDFKEVNDTLGHAAGDRLLRLVADRLRSSLREVDTVARFGGDEFVVLLPGIVDDGTAVAEKLAAALRHGFHLDDEEVRVHASIGFARFPADGADFGDLLQQADIRMYEAKARRQRNRPAT